MPKSPSRFAISVVLYALVLDLKEVFIALSPFPYVLSPLGLSLLIELVDINPWGFLIAHCLKPTGLVIAYSP